MWLCSLHIDYYHTCYDNRETCVPPCPDMCTEVERKCPFLRPNTSYAQAGDPSFICKDSDIYQEGKPIRCYKQCHLRNSDCDLCKSREITSPSTTTSDSTDYSNVTLRNNSSEGIKLRQGSTFLHVVLYVLSVYVNRTLLQYLCTGWT